MTRARLHPERLSAELPEYVIANGTIRVGDELGSGAMGEVFRAEHVRLGRTVAVKFLSAKLLGDTDARLRFEREARSLAGVAHPNIVSIFDAGEEDGTPYLVMEYVDGKPLSALVPLDPAAALETLIAVCDAVAHAHEARVVHRDLKPENVLIRNDGAVKVTDFGLARAIDASGWTVTGDGHAVGTPFHVAPEILRGEPASETSDVYSLGVMLYRVATGKLPVGHFEPAPGALDAICRKAMQTDPARRYANVREMKRALEVARASFGTNVSELSAAERQWLRAVAVLHAVATAMMGWALLLSITPRSFERSENAAIVISEAASLTSGVSLARFEPWPTFAACVAIAIALLSQGFLRRHWAQNALDREAPDVPLRESKTLLAIGVSCIAIVTIRNLSAPHGLLHLIGRYASFYGALLELLAMYVFWHGVLEAIRRGRSLRREPLLWAGVVLTLLPPSVALATYARPWLEML